MHSKEFFSLPDPQPVLSPVDWLSEYTLAWAMLPGLIAEQSPSYNSRSVSRIILFQYPRCSLFELGHFTYNRISVYGVS